MLLSPSGSESNCWIIGHASSTSEDTRTEAKKHDDKAIGVYKPPGPKGTKQTLAGHVPIEQSRLLNNFLRANTESNFFAKVTGKRKRNRTSCTGKILGCYQGIAHRWNFKVRAKQQSYEV